MRRIELFEEEGVKFYDLLLQTAYSGKPEGPTYEEMDKSLQLAAKIKASGEVVCELEDSDWGLLCSKFKVMKFKPDLPLEMKMAIVHFGALLLNAKEEPKKAAKKDKD